MLARNLACVQQFADKAAAHLIRCSRGSVSWRQILVCPRLLLISLKDSGRQSRFCAAAVLFF